MNIIRAEYLKSAVFSRKDTDVSIFKKLMKIAGKVNSKPFIGHSAEKWLCSNPSAIKTGTKWTVTCTFFLMETGWNRFPLVGGGWVCKNVYATIDFGKLGLTEEDFLNDPA